ncbi:unnamed protein product [Effrenium voratum]|nr:unnamed protein product [Effrenium voratum]
MEVEGEGHYNIWIDASILTYVTIALLMAWIALLIIQIIDTHANGRRREEELRLAQLESLKAFERDVEASLPEVHVAEQDICPVCLDDIKPGQPARQLTCKHCFHSACILGWFTHGARHQHKITCPICRCVHPVYQASE